MRFPSLTAAALLAAAPVFADNISVETAQGAVELADNPQTVAVFDIAALDTIDALGLTVAGVPDILYVNFLDDAAAGAEIVGSLFEPDFEALIAIQPDLIIAGGRSATQVEALSGLAPTLDMTIGGQDIVGQALARLDAYGKIFGKEDEAGALASDLEGKIDQARAAVDGKGAALVIMTNGPKVTAYGLGSRFGWLHEAIGLPEAVANVHEATHGEAISFEFIRDANPDWLIVIDRAAAIGEAGEGARKTLDNALVAETSAWQKGQVIYMNAAEIYVAGGGAQSLGNALDQIIDAFETAPDA